MLRLRAAALMKVPTPIHMGAFHTEGVLRTRRRGGKDDHVEIAPHEVRLWSAQSASEPFDIRIPIHAIQHASTDTGWRRHHLWLRTGTQEHGVAFATRSDLEAAVKTLHDLGIDAR